MRIRSIKIRTWRNFENIELNFDDHTPLVCLVGANGTGKSHILELVSACAHQLGLSPGINIPRGNPFEDPHEFSLEFYLSEGASDTVDRTLSDIDEYKEWDRTIFIENSTLDSSKNKIIAGGISGRVSSSFAHDVIQQIQKSREIHFLLLDADRAYPKKKLSTHEIAQAYKTEWDDPKYVRDRSTFPVGTLYEDWIKYLVSVENQYNTIFGQENRRAKKSGKEPPIFEDKFEQYRLSIEEILPHMSFVGVNSQTGMILFDVVGKELSFYQLSGGEREIAFLVGQIDRFGLRQGLFLLDEPELHLNADLVRAWVSFLTSTVSTGQIWIATHSLEAVEAAGVQATFVLERNESTRKVDRISRLDDRPVLSILSRSVGTPAFSISRLLFIFVEGEQSVGERERFRQLAGGPSFIRFIECGSCREVCRRVASLKAIAKETNEPIHIGGIVDRDFRSADDVRKIEQEGIFVLPVHEVENLFLHPETLRVLARQNGQTSLDIETCVREAADSRAGSWIFQYAMAIADAKELPSISREVKKHLKGLTWSQIEVDRRAVVQTMADIAEYDEGDCVKFSKMLVMAMDCYAKTRQDDDNLWRMCEGKNVLMIVARALGFLSPSSLIQAIFAVWEAKRCELPCELLALRNYLSCLTEKAR